MKVLVVFVAVIAFSKAEFSQPTAWRTEPRLINPSNRTKLTVIDGSDAVKGEFPYQAALETVHEDRLVHICGGTILSKRWVITSAICIQDYDTSVLRVAVGILWLTDIYAINEQIVEVSETITHPAYQQGGACPNDISLLRLASLLNFGVTVQSIALSTFDSEAIKIATLSGWGYATNTSDESSEILKYANVTVYPVSECGTRIAQISGYSNTFSPTLNLCTIVTDSSKGATCNGDGGGPLVSGGYLVGIPSWSYRPCGGLNEPSVYVRVSVYVDWILENSNYLS